MRASQHVIRRPVVDEAVPEAVVETRASVTTRIDLTQLSRAVADCVESVGDDEAAIEIQLEAAEVRAYGSHQLPKVGRSGLAHTLRRPGTEPAVEVKPVRALPLPPPPAEPAAPIAHAPVTHTSKTAPITVMDTAQPIDEIAEAHAVAALMGEVSRPRLRMKIGYAIAVLAGVGAAIALIACM
jgi:hypothetical protein